MRKWRRRSEESGQVLVEFCFVLPLLISIFILLVDAGFFLMQTMSVHEAVREGAHMAMFDETAGGTAYTDQQIKNRIKEAAYGSVILDSEIFLDRNDSITVDGVAMRAFNIRVATAQRLIVPFVLSSKASTFTITSSMKSAIVPGLTP